ncbi:R3H domain-containing protein 1-like [Carassius auratus]|uniref:R3H domain-containing protein 1-like n=1 Tax=Carassius auratus TaxID=7957 RepID=A0A6P6Q5H6_CARAU|nr:R3H domain-containing protein 1-like [Carassius auratus]XP_026128670.1 R3H domain-containing protein 1-like [Carassius auratus]XP_026128671.1 R3H domain-containing protein 1-like [Carassius auratus]
MNILKRDNSSTDRDDSVMRMKLKEDRRSERRSIREPERGSSLMSDTAQGLDTFPLDKRCMFSEPVPCVWTAVTDGFRVTPQQTGSQTDGRT